MSADVYWRYGFTALASSRSLTEYIVLDVEHVGAQQGRFVYAEVQVARKSDFGRNETVFYAKTHLGHLLHPGEGPGRAHTRTHTHTTHTHTDTQTHMRALGFASSTYDED